MTPFDNRILYFGRDREQFRFLSHFHRATFHLDGYDWPTVEHFYQFHKSSLPAYRLAIRAAETPGMAKRLAAPPDLPHRFSKHSWFKRHGEKPRADWAVVKLDIMRRGDLAKFAQNLPLAQALLATGDAELIEDSPAEPFWGTGPDKLGLNWAGRVLMEVRAQIGARRLAGASTPSNIADT